jgi:phage tail sheath protein FI
MAGQVSPGIVLRERDLTAQTIVASQTNTAALVGSFEKGPVGVVTNIASEKELLEIFGKPNNNNYEDWFVASTFLSYGGQLQIVRIEDDTLKNADSSSTGVLIQNLNIFETNESSYTWKFAAKSAGSWANGLKVITVDGTVLDGIATVNNVSADDVLRVEGTYNGVSATGGTGAGATFNVVVDDSGAATVIVVSSGTGYTVGDVLTISDSDLGDGGAANLTFAVATLSGWNTQVISDNQLWSTIAAAPSSDDEVHVAVVDSQGNILETFLYLSKTNGQLDDQGASKFYKDVINRRSSFVYSASSIEDGYQTHTLGGGVDSYTTTVSDIESAFDLFVDTEQVVIDFVLCGGSLSSKVSQISKAQKSIAVATSRKDCITFVSPHRGFVSLASSVAQRDEIIAFFDSVGSSTSYAVFDSGYKYIYDRYSDSYRYIPCNGDVAGLCVQTSQNSEDWFSPAGTQRGNIKTAIKLAYAPSKTDRDKLYLKRINPISSFPGQGIVLFGDKTALASPSAFDRINVRRLFLSVEKRINQLAKNVLFELNDATTRNSFLNASSSFLAEIQAKRGITDYLVVCDESNNTADVIDRNEFVAELYIKPTRSINYITVTFVATRTGVSFSEVTGQV